MAPRIVDKEKKKEQILVAAMKVFARLGARGTKVADIAAEAGVGKGTIYEYFRSRDEILVQSFYLVIGKMEDEISEAMNTVDDPAEKVALMLRISWRVFSGYPEDMVAVFLDFWSEGMRKTPGEDEVSIGFREIYDAYRQHLASILQEGIDSGAFRPMNTTAVASVLMAIIDGLALQLILDRTKIDADKILDESVTISLLGIKRPASQSGD